MIVCGLPILRVQAIVGYKADMRWGLGSPIISQKEMSEWMAQECERRALRVCWGQECMCLICRAWIVQARLWLPRPAGSRVLLSFISNPPSFISRGMLGEYLFDALWYVFFTKGLLMLGNRASFPLSKGLFPAAEVFCALSVLTLCFAGAGPTCW